MRISDWSSDVCSSDLPQRATKRARVLITAQNIAGRACAMLACRRAGRMVSTYLKQFDVIDIWMTPTLGTEPVRSEEHTSELQSLMRISYAVFCLKKKKKPPTAYIMKCNNPTQIYRLSHKIHTNRSNQTPTQRQY